MNQQFSIPQGANALLLDQQLRAALSDCAGVVYDSINMLVTVIFTQNPSTQDIATAQGVITAHVPTMQAAAQTAEAARVARVAAFIANATTTIAQLQSPTIDAPTVAGILITFLQVLEAIAQGG